MKIAAWNVNSLFARTLCVERYIKEFHPDILLLQELKTENESAATEFFEVLGFDFVMWGQKSYNGVGIASRYTIEDVTKNLSHFEDTQARYIEAFTGGLRVASVYVPNGQDLNSYAFLYKLDFFEALQRHMQKLLQNDEPVIIGGDFNVAPERIDTYTQTTPEALHTSLKERQAFRALQSSGYIDIVRMKNPHKEQWFSWWDYRGSSWTHNKGLRIDHLLMSPLACDRTQSVGIDTQTRSWEKPSDHAPVWVECT